MGINLNIAIEEKTINFSKIISSSFAKRNNFFYIADVETYNGYNSNKHHWTTNFVWNNFIPFLCGTLGIKEFNPEDFYKKEFFSENGKFDLSYHIPKDDKEVVYYNLTEKSKKETRISGLRLSEKEEVNKRIGNSITNYHRLFIGWHKCGILQRKDDKSTKSLILNCDSMMIPVIPILINYYKNILVLDNRSNMTNKEIIDIFRSTDCDYVSCFIASNIVNRNPEAKNLK